MSPYSTLLTQFVPSESSVNETLILANVAYTAAIRIVQHIWNTTSPQGHLLKNTSLFQTIYFHLDSSAINVDIEGTFNFFETYIEKYKAGANTKLHNMILFLRPSCLFFRVSYYFAVGQCSLEST